MQFDDAADGLLSPDDLADLLAASSTASASAFSEARPVSSITSRNSHDSSEAFCPRYQGPLGFRAPDDDNWKALALTKFLSLSQREHVELPGSLDAWLSASDGCGVGPSPARAPSQRPLARVDSSDSDCASCSYGCHLLTACSNSSIGSSAMTLSTAASGALSSVADSSDDLAAMAHGLGSSSACHPSARPSLLSRLPFDCLPDLDESDWPGFDAGTGSPRGREPRQCELAGARVRLGRPCNPEAPPADPPEPEKVDTRSHGGNYFIAACDSAWAVDASRFWVLPGGAHGGSLCNGACVCTADAQLWPELGPEWQPQGLADPALNGSGLISQLSLDHMPGGPLLPVPVMGTLPHAAARFDWGLESGEDGGISAGAPPARSAPRSTMSGMLQQTDSEEATNSVASARIVPPSVAAAGAAHTRAQSFETAAPFAAAPASAPQPPPAVAAQPPVVAGTLDPAAAKRAPDAEATALGSDTFYLARKGSRSLLDESVRGGRPRRSHGGLALEALAASGWAVDCNGGDAGAVSYNNNDVGTSSTGGSVGGYATTAAPDAPASLPTIVAASHSTAAELLAEAPAAPMVSRGGSGDVRVRGGVRACCLLSAADTAPCAYAAPATAPAPLSRSLPPAPLPPLPDVGSGDACGPLLAGHVVEELSKAELAAVQAAPTWLLLLVLTQRLARGCVWLQSSAMWVALMPWCALVSLAQPLLLGCGLTAGGQRAKSVPRRAPCVTLPQRVPTPHPEAGFSALDA